MVRGVNRTFGDLLANSDTGFKRCLWHLTMTLAGGQKRAEMSEMIEIENASPVDEDILKPVKAYTVRKPCSNAKNVWRKAVEKYSQSRANIRLATSLKWCRGSAHWYWLYRRLCWHPHSLFPEERVAKRNCFGWWFLSKVNSDTEDMTETLEPWVP